MKKTFFPGLVLALIITNTIGAQTSIKAKRITLPAEKISSPPDSAVWNEINANAIRNFTRDYKSVSNAKWFISSNGLSVAYFVREDITNWVFYNKKGDFEHSIRAYQEEKLPTGLRRLIKSTYYDFNIYYVTEINTNSKTAYHVKIADKTSWKTVKVADGEMEVTEEYIKAE